MTKQELRERLVVFQKEENKMGADDKKLLIIVVAVFIAIIFLCGMATRAKEEKMTDDMKEWISPDGVHYWIYCPGTYCGMMAPRYDKNGNIVVTIEGEEK